VEVPEEKAFLEIELVEVGGVIVVSTHGRQPLTFV
jgi:hypothetical protein